MKYRTLKCVTKEYDEIYSQEKQTPEIQITVGSCNMLITEQQCGAVLNQPHVVIYNPKDGVTYNMDFDTFLEKITK